MKHHSLYERFQSSRKHQEREKMIVILFVLVAIVTIFLLKKQRKSIKPPGPPGLPFIGNLHQFNTSAPHIYLWKLSRKYGPIMSMKLGKVPVIVLSSPNLAKEALKTQDLAFSGRPRLHGQNALSYNGLDVAFTTYSNSWRELRKICVLQLFSSKQVKSFRAIREESVARVIEKISSKAKAGGMANLSEMVMFFTANLICRIAFGRKYDEKGSEKREFDRLMIESQVVQGGLFVSDYLPLFSWVDKLSGMMSRVEKVCREMDDFYQELIDEHLESKSPESMNPDLLEILIRLKEDKTCSIDLTWNHIKAVVMDILVAGTDTTAASIIWAMTALIKNPNVMNKLQDEIRDSVGTKGRVSEDDIPKLSYLRAVIKETLRLFPPTPLLLPKETLEETVLGGYKIPPKTTVYVNAWAIARDPVAWENPHEFVPERFLNSNIDVIGQDFEVIPFGSGRRGCPGIALGLATVELILANLVYSFDWEPPCGVKKEDIDTEVLTGLTMHKKNPLCLVPREYFK